MVWWVQQQHPQVGCVRICLHCGLTIGCRALDCWFVVALDMRKSPGVLQEQAVLAYRETPGPLASRLNFSLASTHESTRTCLLSPVCYHQVYQVPQQGDHHNSGSNELISLLVISARYTVVSP